jgi:hypothetical protein
VDLEKGTYCVAAPPERAGTAFPQENVVRKGALPDGQSFGRAVVGGQDAPSPVIIDFTPRGVVPEIRLTLLNADKNAVTLTVGSLVNQVEYAEGN